MNRREFCLSLLGGAGTVAVPGLLTAREERRRDDPCFRVRLVSPDPWTDLRIPGGTRSRRHESFLLPSSGRISKNCMESTAKRLRRIGTGFFVPVPIENSFLADRPQGEWKSIPLTRIGDGFETYVGRDMDETAGFLVFDSDTGGPAGVERWIVLNDCRRCRWKIFSDFAAPDFSVRSVPPLVSVHENRLRLEMSIFLDKQYRPDQKTDLIS